MRAINNSGFTLMELLLFIIIGTALLGVAMSSVGTRTQQVQFSDGMRALEVYLQRQFSDIQNGSVDNKVGCQSDGSGGYPGTPGALSISDGSCLFLGSLFEFADPESTSPGNSARGLITTHQVVGTRLDTDEALACTDYSLYCVYPTTQTGIAEQFEIPWGIELYRSGAVTLGGGGSRQTKIFGFIREPSSTKILPIVIVDDKDKENYVHYDKNEPSVLAGGVSRFSGIDEEVNAFFCFEDAQRELYASVTIESGFTSSSVQVGFNPSDDFNAECTP